MQTAQLSRKWVRWDLMWVGIGRVWDHTDVLVPIHVNYFSSCHSLSTKSFISFLPTITLFLNLDLLSHSNFPHQRLPSLPCKQTNIQCSSISCAMAFPNHPLFQLQVADHHLPSWSPKLKSFLGGGFRFHSLNHKIHNFFNKSSQSSSPNHPILMYSHL